MTAIPAGALIEATSIGAALVVPGRVRAPQLHALRVAAEVTGFPCCAVVRGRGRRAGAPEALVKELLDAGATSVVVPSLAALHPSPPRALAIVAVLSAAGLTVHSLAEPAIAAADSATLSTIASFLLAAEQRRASKVGSKIITVAKNTGKRVGRPPKPLPVPVEQVRSLVERHSYRRVGVMLGISSSGIRRALLKADAFEQKLNQKRGSP